MSNADRDYLRHILDEITYLQEQTQNIDFSHFHQDETLKRAFVRSLEVIGEATKNLSESFRKTHPDINWRALAGMRDRLIHGYFGVDYEIVWDVAKNKSHPIRKHIEAILDEEV